MHRKMKSATYCSLGLCDFFLLILYFGPSLTFHYWFSVSRCLTMTHTSVMSVTASPWIPIATREAVRDTTLVNDTVRSCVFVHECLLTYQPPQQKETDGAKRPYSVSERRRLSVRECDCDQASVSFSVFFRKYRHLKQNITSLACSENTRGHFHVFSVSTTCSLTVSVFTFSLH